MKKPIPIIPATGAKRRSTRVACAVPVLVTSADVLNKAFVEETATLSINCHGCRYFSRYRPKIGSQVIIQVILATEDSFLSTQPHSARVVWRQRSKRLEGFYQIGLEFDSPLNLWHIESAPRDWEPFAPDETSTQAVSKPEIAEEPGVLLAEAERLLEFAREGTHYQLLDVTSDMDRSAVKRKFYHLAQRFHPDRNMDHPEWTPQLEVLMDALTTAYRILSDEEAKKRYNSALAEGSEHDPSETKRVAQECLEKAHECLAERNYVGSILWLRRAIDNEPDTSGHRAMLAHSLANIPEYRREAVEQFEKALELDPHNITAHLQYGQLLEKLKAAGRARFHYLRVLELVMDHGEARERLNRLDSAIPRSMPRHSLLGRLMGRR